MATTNSLFRLPPLGKHNDRRHVSPDAYLSHLETEGSLPLRDSLVKLAPGSSQLSLDPKPKTGDTTMDRYLERTSEVLDRETIHVMTDCQGQLDALVKKIEQVDAFKKELDEMKTRLDDTTKRLDATTKRLDATEHRLDTHIDENLSEKLSLYSGNLLVRMVQIIYRKQREDDPALEKNPTYRNASELIDRDSFEEKYGLSVKYHDMLAGLPEAVKKRNEAAHKTHRDFALLLKTTKDKRPEIYELWAELFPFCHGRTVDQLAESRQRELDMMGKAEEEGEDIEKEIS